MADQPGIDIVDLHYAYGTRPALAGVSLAVRCGHFTALLGPNGAGKTTLVSLLCGLIVPDRGELAVFGTDLARSPLGALAQMGIVFQQPTVDLDLTVTQNMAYYAALRGIAGAAARRRIDDCLERMGIAEQRAEKARALAGGHRRRLEIARALVHEPRLLLLDEPTVGLDVPSRAALVEHVHALVAAEGLTVLWATHLVDEVWAEDDLVVLHEGRVRGGGAVHEVLGATGAGDVLDAFNRLTADGEDGDRSPRSAA